MAFLSKRELIALGLSSVGKEVRISDKCSIYGAQNISIGDNVRIDDFCVISAMGENGNLEIGSHIHIAVHVTIFAGAGIYVGDFCTISSKATLYSTSDDYSGQFLIGPQIPEEYLKIDKRPIIMEKYSAIGAHSLILPGVILGEGSVLGAMSMANKNLDPWFIYGGVPAKKLRERNKDLVNKAKAMIKESDE